MYKITTPCGAEYYPPAGTCWKNVEEVYLQQAAEGRFWYGTDGKGMPRRKTYLAEKQGRNMWTWWPNSEVGHTQEATKEIKSLFADTPNIFDFPKPTRLPVSYTHLRYSFWKEICPGCFTIQQRIKA